MARLSIIVGVLVIFHVCYVSQQENVTRLVTKNESSSTTTEPSKSRILYDYQTRVVAYKDLTDWQCLLETLGDGESLISKWVANGSKGNVSKVFLVSRQNLAKPQIWKLAGHRIVEFCRGFPTFIVIDQNVADDMAINEIQNVRRKRATRRYFQGRMGAQTQSQYLNFGKTDQPGKAEAESSFEGSKAVVSGTSGMGQAQSQSISYGCDECYGQGSNGYDQEQTIGIGSGRPGQKFPEHIQNRPGELSGTEGVGPDETQFGGRPDQFGTPTQNGGSGLIGGRPHSQIGQTRNQFGRPEQNLGPGQIDGTGTQGGNGNGHNGGGHTQINGGLTQLPERLPESQGQPSQIPGQLPDQFPARPDQAVRGPGQVSRLPTQINGGSKQVTPPLYVQRPGQTLNGPGKLEQVPGGSGRPGPNGNENIRRPGQIDVGQSGRGPEDFGRPIEADRFGSPGQTEINRPVTNYGPTQVGGGGELGTVIDLGDSIQRPVQHGGTFGGQLNGDYQGNYGYTGRFSGQFSGQYEGSGPSSLGYAKPQGNQLTQQGGVGYQPQGGAGVTYQSRPNGQSGVQGPSTSNGYYSGSGQPDHNSQYPGGQGGYQPNGGGGISQPIGGQISSPEIGHQPIGPEYGSQVTPQQTNGYHINGGSSPVTGHQPLRPGYGGQITPGQTNGYHTNGGSSPVGGQQPLRPDYGSQITPGQTNGYHTNGGSSSVTGHQPLRPDYGSQITPGQTNGHHINGGSFPITGHQPLGPDYGSQITPGQTNGQQTTGHYGNGLQNGQQPQGSYRPHQGQEIGQGGYQPTSEYSPGYGPGYETPTGTGGGTDFQSGPRPSPGYQPGYTESVPPGELQQHGIPAYYGQGEDSQDNKHTPGSNGQYGNGFQGQVQGQGGTAGTTNQHGNGYQYGIGDNGQNQTDVEGEQDFDDSDAQVQTSVHQTDNGTHAEAAAQGVYGGGTANSQVSGTYAGTGSFSASAGSDDGKRGAQTQVSGGDYGARSSAQGRGGKGNSQAEVVLSSETGDTFSTAQSGDVIHGTQSEVRASEKGGMADAQANGQGSTSSQAQIGFSPYDDKDEDNQTTPFRGSGMAGAQSGALSGMTQAQVQGRFLYGIKYVGGAQAGTGGVGLGKNATFRPGPFKPVDIAFYPRREENSQPQAQTIDKNEEPITTTSSEDKIGKTSHNDDDDKNDDAQDDGEDYSEGDYDSGMESPKPSPKNIITQSSKNQRQHIVLDPLEDLDITVHQSKGDFPEEGTVLQPGQTIPGTSGYRIPAGFRGTVKSISNGHNTYAIGKHSQAQSVTLSPGTGRIIYKQPVYAVSSNTHYRNGKYGYGSGYTYQPAYRPVQYLLKNGKVLPNFVSVTKSETGSQNVYTGQRTPKIYYSQSSSCGVFTNHCVINAGRKLCFPKAKTNPDGTLMGC